MGLTKRDVDGASYDPNGPGWQWIPDGGDKSIPGFGVRLLPSGRKSFILRYYTRQGRRRYLTLGAYGTLTVSQARDKARRELGKALEGEDPAEDRKEARQGIVFKEFAEAYVRRMEKRWAAKTCAEYQRRIQKHLLPAWKGTRLEEITRSQVSNLLEKVAEGSGPTESNRVHELVRAMFNRAAAWGHFPEDKPNPATRIERFKERPRERWLKEEEVERLMAAVGKQADPFFRAFVPLLLLTGMRKGELLGLTWENVDLERGEVLLPKTKSGRPQARKLSPPAVQILRFLPRDTYRPDGEEGPLVPHPHVFPATGTKSKPGTHRRDFKSEWNEAREAADLEDITLHDLRRTSGSYMAQAGVPLQVIGEVLGHTHPSITKVYARLSEQNERDALDALGTKLQGLMGQGEGGAS